MKFLRQLITIVTIAAIALVTAITAAIPAQAAARDGICQKGEFCYYYNSNNKGSISDFTTSVGDYGTDQPSCYDYKGRGAGKGRCIKNDAASVWNRTGKTVRVHYNSNYAGTSQKFTPGAKKNLNARHKNNNASHKIGASNNQSDLSYALYKLSGGRLTTGFDGYQSTDGRHEGIDFARGVGSPVRSLINGKVIRIEPGNTGRPGLSTIAVYNSGFDKTIVYLHTKPASGLREGQTVRRGDKIATESWRGITYRSSAHTHVEMRLGRHKYAAPSVGDSNLQNPDPSTFWRARGYNVR